MIKEDYKDPINDALPIIFGIGFFLSLILWFVTSPTKTKPIFIEPETTLESTILDNFIPDTLDKQNALIEAIYYAEGGSNAKKPFGILSVSCEGYKDCRKICHNTVRNNIGRWKRANSENPISYLQFLAGRYAPVGASNDPGGLNHNWLRNVRWFLENPKEVIL